MLPIRTALLLLSSLAFFAARAAAQPPAFAASSTPGLWDANSLPSDFGAVASSPSSSRVPHLRLFRFAPGYLSDPLGLQQDDDFGLPGMPTLPGADVAATAPDTGPDWIQVGMGTDNPYFDLRLPGDPGGFGFFRLNTQVALFDSPTTACAFNVQAVTPAGAQFGGVPTGATVVIPAFSVFHALSDQIALQGFVSKNVPISDAAGYPLQRNLQYGLAVQRPLLPQGPEGLRSLFFSVGALGQMMPDRDTLRPVANYDVLPGLQWHVNDNWWMTSGLLLPLNAGTIRPAPGQWQLTCSLQF